MNTSSIDLKNRVVTILKKVRPDCCSIIEENFDKPLLGDTLGFDACDLFFVLLEIMEEFKVPFDKEDIENYNFSTINNIIRVLESKDLVNSK